jgi:hypothetical protein
MYTVVEAICKISTGRKLTDMSIIQYDRPPKEHLVGAFISRAQKLLFLGTTYPGI